MSGFDLQRFVDAQEGSYDRALAELYAGRKRSHWIWYVFPQIAGLGISSTSKAYAISGLPEARAYLEHPVLGPRLVECARVLTELPGSDPRAVFDHDAVKVHSCMTLFARASDEPVFREVLDQYYGRREDDGTLRELAKLGQA